ncbi:hypothetical protein [Veillonella rogosae]|uniref:hypothetical protein n=1 Tax=Veillonella rogosae TaxID=423477 RepID=UPI0006D1A751|nr:hypothetical protein [Veillonella rogosae]
MAELNEQMLRAIIMDIMDEVGGMLKEEPVQVQPKEELKAEHQEPELKDLIRQMLVDMQRN